MDEREEIRQLAKKLKKSGVDMDTAINISLQVDEQTKRAQMIEWLDQNPTASVRAICAKARALQKEE